MPGQGSRDDSGQTISGRLVGRFGPRRGFAREAVRRFYEVLVQTRSAGLREALDRWRAAAGRTESDVRSPGTDALAEAYGISPADCRTDRLVFAAQTYFAAAVKLLVGEAFAALRRWPSPSELAAAPNGESRLRQWLQDPVTDDLLDGRLFSWPVLGRNDDVDALLRRMAAAGVSSSRRARSAPAAEEDPLKALYEAVFPRRFRHASGEFYTPGWLVREMLDELDYPRPSGLRLLDPACGSGAFLIEAIRRLRGLDQSPGSLFRTILGNVAGYDVNPLAVLAARANWLMATADLLPESGPVEVPIVRRDSILDAGPSEPFDCVVGNPPWIAWDDLAPGYREATRPLWQRYGLFSLSAGEARHGGGKKDLSMLMAYVAADRYLNEGGRLAMVVTQTPFQTKGAGDGFRRFRLGSDGAWLRVLRVNDLVALRPFDAANWTATVLLAKGEPTVYPVPYVKWLPTGKRAGIDEPAQTLGPDGREIERRRFEAWPIDPERPTSPWLVWPLRPGADDRRHPLAGRIGPSDYRAHLGANTGGANGVYWLDLAWDRLPARHAEVEGSPRQAGSMSPVESPSTVLARNVPGRGKRSVPEVEMPVERELVYPLLRWGEVHRFRAAPKLHLLLAQDLHTRRGIDEAVMRSRYPLAYAYLDRFREWLARRAAYRRYQEGGPFYSMYDVGPYTAAPVKVVWRRMDRQINAAVVEQADDPRLGPRPVVPQETCVLVAADSADEAHYLCALLNSAGIGSLVAAHSVCGGKSFGTPGMLDYLSLRRFDPADPWHQALACLSRQAHAKAARGEELAEVQSEIDETARRTRGG